MITPLLKKLVAFQNISTSSSISILEVDKKQKIMNNGRESKVFKLQTVVNLNQEQNFNLCAFSCVQVELFTDYLANSKNHLLLANSSGKKSKKWILTQKKYLPLKWNILEIPIALKQSKSLLLEVGGILPPQKSITMGSVFLIPDNIIHHSYALLKKRLLFICEEFFQEYNQQLSESLFSIDKKKKKCTFYLDNVGLKTNNIQSVELHTYQEKESLFREEQTISTNKNNFQLFWKLHIVVANRDQKYWFLDKIGKSNISIGSIDLSNLYKSNFNELLLPLEHNIIWTNYNVLKDIGSKT